MKFNDLSSSVRGSFIGFALVFHEVGYCDWGLLDERLPKILNRSHATYPE